MTYEKSFKIEAVKQSHSNITIKHTLTCCNVVGKRTLVASDTTKTKSSMRTLPLVPQFREMLLERYSFQEECKQVCGKCYNKEYLDYVCVDEMGNLLNGAFSLFRARFCKIVWKRFFGKTFR